MPAFPTANVHKQRQQKAQGVEARWPLTNTVGYKYYLSLGRHVSIGPKGTGLSAKNPAPKDKRKIHAVSHLAEILRCVSRSTAPIGVNELARRVGLDKSSVSRLAASLEEERLLQRSHDGGVRLGMGLLAIAAPLMRDLGLSTRVRPSQIGRAHV